jgi:competence protein ComGC
MSTYRRTKAFTLLELLIVTVLLSAIMGLILPSWSKAWNSWTYGRERLQIIEEREHLFQKIQEDLSDMILDLRREDCDFQIIDNGTGIVFLRRRSDGVHDYILWWWDGCLSTAVSSEYSVKNYNVYRSQTREYPEASKDFCDRHVLNTMPYFSFRKMFLEYPVDGKCFSRDLFTEHVILWKIQYVDEGDFEECSENMLLYEDFPEFFSWRAWTRGDLSLDGTLKWIAISIAMLPPMFQKQWECLPQESREAFLQRYGIFGTRLVPFPRG